MAPNDLIRASIRVVALIAIQKITECLDRKKRKRRCWVRKWIARRNELGASTVLIRELENEDEASFENHFRMNLINFRHLLSLVGPTIQRKNSLMRDAIPARLKLQVALRYLASGDSFSSLQYMYRIPKSTISKFMPEVLDAIYDALKVYLKTPCTQEEWKEIENGFATRWHYPGCVGAIDGKHVMIRCPQNSGSQFHNYKGTFSIILLALVDSNYCFTYIDVGAAGRESDGGVFSRSPLKAKLEDGSLNVPAGSVIVGDDAFPLKPYLMKPYPRTGVYTLGHKIYNYRHSRSRRIAENAFGILVSKYRIFEKPIALSVDKAEKVILACCTLHNWLRKTSSTYVTAGLTDTENWETGEIVRGSWHNLQINGMHDVEALGSNNYSREAARIRDKYCNFFLTTGSVPWQNNMV